MQGLGASLAQLRLQPTLNARIIASQEVDADILEMKEQVSAGRLPGFQIRDGVLWFGERLCVPNQADLKESILQEAHATLLSVHPGSTKIYKDIKQHFWSGLKRDVADFVAKCEVCQQVKAENQRPGGLLQPLPIPEWKLDNISMDFITGLPKSPKGNDAIWVIVDRLTKSAHFLAMKLTASMDKLAELYVGEIV